MRSPRQPDGRVVASTDRSMPYGSMIKNDGPSQLKPIRNGWFRNTGRQSFEIIIPVKAEFNGIWFLRVGFSSYRQQLSLLHVETFAVCIVMISLSVGIFVYISVIRRDIIGPIRNLVKLAGQISKGNLKDTISTDRQDEVGQLIASMNDMVVDLRDMAGIANAIASGDLSVRVQPRSDEDVFGQAFPVDGCLLE